MHKTADGGAIFGVVHETHLDEVPSLLILYVREYDLFVASLNEFTELVKHVSGLLQSNHFK